jgi:Flp pilus assembly protein TadD
MAEAHLSLGQALRQTGDAAGSVAALQEAHRLNKVKADGQAATFAVSAGKSKLAAGDLAGAIASFREAVRLAPAQAEAHHQLALALEKSPAPGAKAEARRHLAEARRLAPYLDPAEAP